MEINISKTTVLEYREINDSEKEFVNCNDIKCFLVDCDECIFNDCNYTIEELKNDNRIKMMMEGVKNEKNKSRK
ncbi:hypothetical protein [Terrisporobacter sp.]|uniref:hypothetical protein n=1 Tax=Terrisporobacter sp. TaxID=1965305 RepID=UPI00260FB202|nr:hypothetical protein [Terrisporobacter sp.]